MNAIDALIFDVDGTLAETEEVHRQAFNATFANADLDWVWDEQTYSQLLRVTGGKERMRAWRQHYGAGPDDARIATLHAEKTVRFGKLVAQGELKLRPGVADLIANARNAGLKLAVATTTSVENVDALCHAAWDRPASQVFDTIAAGDMVANKKPEPDVYLLALEQLGISASSALAFEDSRNGVISAKKAGLRVLATPSIYTSADDLSGADWSVADLTPPNLPAPLLAALAR